VEYRYYVPKILFFVSIIHIWSKAVVILYLSLQLRWCTVKMVHEFPVSRRDVTNQTPPEYVILEDFNFTLGRLYPRYNLPQLDLYLGYLLSLLNVISLTILAPPPPPPMAREYSVIRRFFPCEDSDHLYPGYLYLHGL
jgi:hypothetical protein